MPKNESSPNFAQEQLLYSIFKEADVPPGNWRASRLPEPEAQDIVLHRSTKSGAKPGKQPGKQPEERPGAQPDAQPSTRLDDQRADQLDNQRDNKSGADRDNQSNDQPNDQPIFYRTSYPPIWSEYGMLGQLLPRKPKAQPEN